MKQLYTLLTAAILGSVLVMAQTAEVSTADIVNLQGQEIKASSRTTQMRAPETGWGETETCSVVDGILDKYYWDDSDGYDTYKADFQRNTTSPGWIRVMIFNKHSKAAYGMFNAINDQWLNIYLYDPEKVYAERCCFFGDGSDDNPGCVTYQKVPEDGWTGTAIYGTFKDNVITWPKNAFVTQWGANFVSTNLKGKFQISLPGGAVTDYSVGISTDVCRADNKYPFTITHGETVASYKYIVTPGLVTKPEPYADVIKAQGTALPVTTQILNLDATDATQYRDGVWTILLAALDAQGNVQNTAAAHCYVLHDVASEWRSIGNAQYNEGVYGPIYYGKAYNAVSLSCEAQQNVANPGLYRLVNPYKDMPHYFDNDYDITSFCTDSPNHYIIIDAVDPAHVTVKATRLGIDFGQLGEGAIWSKADNYLDAGYTIAECEAKNIPFGTLSSGTITWPDDALYLAEPTVGNGSMSPTGTDVWVKLPVSGITDITTGIPEGPVTYYNLQGQPLISPTHGLPCIKVQNGHATKVL